MFTLPLLISEDIAAVDSAMTDLLTATGARLALFIDQGGFAVTQQGDARGVDVATLGALAANSFAATQAIGKIIEDHSVTSLYQEGVENSFLILSVGESGFLAIVFRSEIGVGAVKFYSEDTVARITKQLAEAHLRSPDEGFDLSSLNIADTGALFHRRAAT